jgi:negative regulator of genetic competence, sporulation and motility
MVRIIDKEIQEERVVDDVLSLLGEHNNVKFIKVCRPENSPTIEAPTTDKENSVAVSPEVEMSEAKSEEEEEDSKDESEEEDADTVQFITDLNDIELLLGNSTKSSTGWGCLEQSDATIAV